MPSTAICCLRPAAAFAAGMILLGGCAAVGWSDGRQSACPPVMEYSRAEQARVAEEVAALPQGSPIAEMLADYAVMRDQARACATR